MLHSGRGFVHKKPVHGFINIPGAKDRCRIVKQILAVLHIDDGVTLLRIGPVVGRQTGPYPAAAAQFNLPTSITTDGTYLYVGDASNQKIRKIAIATGAVVTLAGSGAAATTDGTGAAATFKYPDGITTDGVSLFVADRIGNKIRRIR